jgi:hypothetical protein
MFVLSNFSQIELFMASFQLVLLLQGFVGGRRQVCWTEKEGQDRKNEADNGNYFSD